MNLIKFIKRKFFSNAIQEWLYVLLQQCALYVHLFCNSRVLNFVKSFSRVPEEFYQKAFCLNRLNCP